MELGLPLIWTSIQRGLTLGRRDTRIVCLQHIELRILLEFVCAVVSAPDCHHRCSFSYFCFASIHNSTSQSKIGISFRAEFLFLFAVALAWKKSKNGCVFDGDSIECAAELLSLLVRCDSTQGWLQLQAILIHIVDKVRLYVAWNGKNILLLPAGYGWSAS